MGIRQLGQRKSGRAHIKALHIEGGLDGDRVDLNEELLDQRQRFELQLFGLLISSFETVHHKVVRLTDVGVSGLHRLLSHLDEIMSATVIIAVAGMEGALPSVIAGLADCPVIAVPTSVGYGAGFGGVSALLAMLNSCASGVSVVNIDNGFGAGYQAAMINRK